MTETPGRPAASPTVPGRRLDPVPGRRLDPVPGRRLDPVPGRRLDPVPGRRLDLVALGVEVALVATATIVGALLNARGVRLYADAAPLYASWQPHVGWGTPLAVAVAVLVVAAGPGWARRASWPALLVSSYLGALAWTLALALVDGWSAGIAERLTPQAEYLHEVPKVDDIPAMLAGFTDRILDFQPGSWSTHTAGHPPGALLIFVWLDRVGLGGGAAAGLACVLVGATAAVWVPLALRALGAEPAARAVVPFLVLLPGAVWVGASADGIFTAVVAAGLALLALAVCRGGRAGPVRRWPWALAGGLVLGFALHLSYGFALVGLLAVAVLAVGPAAIRDRLAVLGVATAGVAVVVAVFTAFGFWWLDGYELVVQRYYQGWAADRPYGYWVWANLAAFVLSAGPVAGPALARVAGPALAALAHVGGPTLARVAGPTLARVAGPTLARVAGSGPLDGRRPPARLERQADRVVVWLAVAAAAAVVAADLSGLSKAEVERIWLPFAVWLLVAAARLPAAGQRWWLAGQAVTALAVNHLLWTVS